MPRIFISYRRDDSGETTGRIYDRLAAKFGARNVFKDVDNIPVGADFPTYIQESLRNSDVAVIIIGPKWASATDSQGFLRLNQLNDFVRIEVESILNRNIPIIPILVQNATMPGPQLLPPGLQSLSYRNATAVRPDPDFHRDMERVIGVIDSIGRRVPSVPQRAVAPNPAVPSQQPKPNNTNQMTPQRSLPQKYRWFPIITSIAASLFFLGTLIALSYGKFTPGYSLFAGIGALGFWVSGVIGIVITIRMRRWAWLISIIVIQGLFLWLGAVLQSPGAVWIANIPMFVFVYISRACLM